MARKKKTEVKAKEINVLDEGIVLDEEQARLQKITKDAQSALSRKRARTKIIARVQKAIKKGRTEVIDKIIEVLDEDALARETKEKEE